MKHIWFNIKHQLGDFLILVKLRDRLKCPKCGAIGTYKSHGGWIDYWVTHTPRYRRWLCKWCGYYETAEWKSIQRVNYEERVWDHGHNCPSYMTPRKIYLIGWQLICDLHEEPEDSIRRKQPSDPWIG